MEVDSVEVVAYISSCDNCVEKETCQALPDEELEDEAITKLKGIVLARILGARVFDEWSEFQSYIRKKTGIEFQPTIVVIDEEAKSVMIEPVGASPLILVISDGRLSEIILETSFKTKYLQEQEENVRAIVRRFGAKKIMQMNPDELVEILGVEKR